MEPLSGIVGGPLHNVKMKIKNESDFDIATPGQPVKGELCFFSSSLTPGYFKRDDKTNQHIQNGWYHTGDIVELLENGAIKFIDRISNFVRLSTGDQVGPS